MLLSRHFKLGEFTNGQDAPEEIGKNIRTVANELEIIRRICGDVPIRITSGYRDAARNQRVGGSATSDHVKGKAADFQVEGMTPGAVLVAITRHIELIQFDQLIIYDSHIHIGCRTPKANRRQVLFK